MTMNVSGYAAHSAVDALRPHRFPRREPRADDVVIDILYCGVCHSDLHYARNDWGRTTYPLVPGHEIIGRVVSVGPDVTRFKPGDQVLVGYLGDLDPMLNTVPLIMGRKSVAGSVIGGIAETQEMLDFCGEHGITSDIELIAIRDINQAYERMLRSDVKYRFVIDMTS